MTSQQRRRQDTPGPQTSIILVGQRGSGLSSFAVITAQLTGFKIIDVEACFVKKYGKSRAGCLQAWGEQYYRDEARSFLFDQLLFHAQSHVLVCVIDPTTLSVLREYGSASPVVMVSRDIRFIQDRLSFSEKPATPRILRASQLLCRRASSVEFHNLSEEVSPEALSTVVFDALRSHQAPARHTKRLRNVTQDVARFLSMLGHSIAGDERFFESFNLESREFPSYTSVSPENVTRAPPSTFDADCSSDALELAVPCSQDWPSHHEELELISEAFQIIRRHHSIPIIYHVESKSGPELENSKRYLELCHHGMRLLPEYTTIDLRCSDHEIEVLIAGLHRYTKIVAHRTFSARDDFSWQDPFLFQQCRRAAALGCHHIRFIRFAACPSEDRACTKFQILANSFSSIRVSAVVVDKFARSSAVSSSGLIPVGQPKFQFADEGKLLPTPQELNQARFSSFLYHPLHFHIFGASVDYSLSPALHNTAFEFHGLQHSYSACQSSSLEDLRGILDETFGGASISLPFKTQAMSLLDSLSESAKIIKAVNTILPLRTTIGHPASSTQTWTSISARNRAGKIAGLHGENTDWTALRNCIRRRLSAANAITSSSAVFVVGAGGMARASVYALMSLGVKNIVVWNRTLSRAQQLVEDFRIYALSQVAKTSWTQRQQSTCQFHVLESLDDPWPTGTKQPTIIICTPPAHMINGVPGLDFKIPLDWFQSTTGGVVVELSYLSKSTTLLQQAYEAAHRGWVVVEPLELLIEQGCAQFELFVGRAAPKIAITQSVIKTYLDA